jgi:dTDP-3,4-didehydro-2,6-dideoxy-alpha-D-glucose 3-reductase
MKARKILMKEEKLNIGILGASKFAVNKILPALENNNDVNLVAIAIASENERAFVVNGHKHKTNLEFIGNKLFKFDSFIDLIKSDYIDAVYIPLPPKLHFFWAKISLENRKHVILEKPSVLELDHALELVSIARRSNLALTENFAFMNHKQTLKMFELIDLNEIGSIRLIKASFGYPFRGESDHRYSKELGGGALNDAGCYTIKIARKILGSGIDVSESKLIFDKNYKIDIFGAGTLFKGDIIAQISFGIDNYYECNLEIWGSKGKILMPRIFTAPHDFEATIRVYSKGEELDYKFKDNQFSLFFSRFKELVFSDRLREIEYNEIVEQSRLISKFRLMATERDYEK